MTRFRYGQVLFKEGFILQRYTLENMSLQRFCCESSLRVLADQSKG